ncbi:MAG: YeeE/YedE family protein [Rhodospirillaceae bacterium]
MKRAVIALICGSIFGLGLTLSEMVNPAKVLNFLDVFGTWDPSLILVMGGAVVTTFIGYQLVLKRASPIFSEVFQLPTAKDFDSRLVTGAILFGVGWGLVGFCPGPALTALLIGGEPVVYLVLSMMVGMFLADQLFAPKVQKPHHRHSKSRP